MEKMNEKLKNSQKLEKLLMRMGTWKKLLDVMDDTYYEYRAQQDYGKSIKDQLVSEAREFLTFDTKEVFEHPFYKGSRNTLNENIEAFLDFYDPVTEEEKLLADQLEIIAYQR